MNLHFLHTNDVHSHLEQYLVTATQIRRLRESLALRGEAAFLFDIGDHADRMRPETDGTMGLINASLLKAMAYDAWVFGNNEGLIIPRGHWQSLCEQSGTAVLNSNLRDLTTGSSLPFFQDHLLLEQNGVRIGVFGATAPYNDYYQMQDIQALAPEQVVPFQVHALREQGAEMVVFLSHLGLPADRQLANEVKGIDLILGAHTHNLLETPELVGRTWIAQAGKFGSHFGHITADYDREARCILNVNGRVYARDEGLQPDSDLQQLLQEWGRRAEVILDRELANVSVELQHQLHADSELGNLVADEMLEMTEAEIAFINTGVFLNGIPAGPLTRRGLLACCPSPINPAVIKLYGWQMREILEQALDPDLIYRRGMGFGFRGKEIGSLSIAGMRVVLDKDRKICEIWAGPHQLMDERQYTAVTADYLLFSGVYKQAAQVQRISLEPLFLREIIERAVSVPYKIRQAKVRRWTHAA